MNTFYKYLLKTKKHIEIKQLIKDEIEFPKRTKDICSHLYHMYKGHLFEKAYKDFIKQNETIKTSRKVY